MEELTIYTLISMIRSFSNEITIKALAHKLGISYSTLARCKNGIWPPSITFDAMKNVIDGCLAGSGVPSRLTLDIFPIMYSNKALIELGRWIHEEWTK